jgi:hypothetical protein
MSSYRAKENWLKKMNSSEGNQLLGTLHGLDENHLLCIKAVVENLKPTFWLRLRSLKRGITVMALPK